MREVDRIDEMFQLFNQLPSDWNVDEDFKITYVKFVLLPFRMNKTIEDTMNKFNENIS